MAYFKKMLAPETEPRRSYKPSRIRIPFTAEEIRRILKKLKNGKSAGIDKLEVEFLKYAWEMAAMALMETQTQYRKVGKDSLNSLKKRR